jgi:class 3 adenylate cyclase
MLAPLADRSWPQARDPPTPPTYDPTVRRPPTSYLSVGRERVAHQVFGEGPTTLLLLQPPFISIEASWETAGQLRLLHVAAERFRVVMLDHRGFGVSDTIDEAMIGTPGVAVDEVLALLDALDVDRVCVLGEDAGALNAITLAILHPERVERLAAVNGLVTGWFHGTDPGRVEVAAERLRETWGRGDVLAASPHFSDDRELLGRVERIGARPSAIAAFVRNSATVDLRPTLGRIRAPTLVARDSAAPPRVNLTEDLAAEIPDARFFSGASTSFYWGGGLVEECTAFLSGQDAPGSRDLATVLFTDVVDSTRKVAALGDEAWHRTLDVLDDLVEACASRLGGRVVKQTGDGHLLEFGRPGDAVDAALALCREAPTLGLQLRAGIHTGEVERRENGDLGGLSVHVAARVAAAAGPGELVVSRTVVDLLGSGGHVLTDRGEHELKGVDGRWQLFSVGT